jgi:hypothetical protein
MTPHCVLAEWQQKKKRETSAFKHEEETTMKNLKFAAAAAAFLSAAAMAGAAQADEVFQCTGSHAGLSFVMYENGNTPTGGHMYINNLQVAVLNVYRYQGNDFSARASVVGNTVGTEFILNRSRKEVYIVLNGTDSLVCAANVIES